MEPICARVRIWQNLTSFTWWVPISFVLPWFRSGPAKKLHTCQFKQCILILVTLNQFSLSSTTLVQWFDYMSWFKWEKAGRKLFIPGRVACSFICRKCWSIVNIAVLTIWIFLAWKHSILICSRWSKCHDDHVSNELQEIFVFIDTWTLTCLLFHKLTGVFNILTLSIDSLWQTIQRVCCRIVWCIYMAMMAHARQPLTLPWSPGQLKLQALALLPAHCHQYINSFSLMNK